MFIASVNVTPKRRVKKKSNIFVLTYLRMELDSLKAGF